MANKKPQHIAIIMDGNGRWAEKRGLNRLRGHRKGADAVKRTVEAARDLGILYLTLFSFSSENWNRPAEEVGELMGLLRYYLKKETAEMHKNGVCLKVIGDRARLDTDIVELIENAEKITAENTNMTVIIALSYGGRQDITYAARKLAEQVKSGDLNPDDINEELFAQNTMTQGIPDPDLLIRTSGETRISNFLLWQLAYAELYFTDRLWPDFDKSDLEEALEFYKTRNRRYGLLPNTEETSDAKGRKI